jgi:hypothetical protein
MRREGFDLYHNPEAPGWKWTWNTTAEAYELEDAMDLNDYVEQLPVNNCDKSGQQDRGICPQSMGSVPDEGESRESWLGVRSAPTKIHTPPSAVQFVLSPNPVDGDEIAVTITHLASGPVTLRVLDGLGITQEVKRIDCDTDRVETMIDVSKLHDGLYTVVLDGVSQGVRFVRM